MFPTSHLYLPLSYNRANIENVPWTNNISCYDITRCNLTRREYIYIYVCMYSTKQFLLGGMDWKRMLNMYVLFVRIIFRSTKNGGKKKERKKEREV